jgi:hypothetical protein
MASASLVNPIRVEGGTAYQVETWPFDASPFNGPDARDWAGFELLEPGSARYEWRTRADRLLAAIHAVEDGDSPEKLVEDPVVAEYVVRIADADPIMRGAGVVELAAAILPGLVWRDLVEAGGPWSAYASDDDLFLHEAAAALELPEWARRLRRAAGGPGSGHDAALVVIDDGHTLAELADWLAGRGGRSASGGGRA